MKITNLANHRARLTPGTIEARPPHRPATGAAPPREWHGPRPPGRVTRHGDETLIDTEPRDQAAQRRGPVQGTLERGQPRARLGPLKLTQLVHLGSQDPLQRIRLYVVS